MGIKDKDEGITKKKKTGGKTKTTTGKTVKKTGGKTKTTTGKTVKKTGGRTKVTTGKTVKKTVTRARKTKVIAEDDVRREAYFKYVDRGNTHGADKNDWYEAEKELKKKKGR